MGVLAIRYQLIVPKVKLTFCDTMVLSIYFESEFGLQQRFAVPAKQKPLIWIDKRRNE